MKTIGKAVLCQDYLSDNQNIRTSFLRTILVKKVIRLWVQVSIDKHPLTYKPYTNFNNYSLTVQSLAQVNKHFPKNRKYYDVYHKY